MGWMREALAGLLFGVRGLVTKELQTRSRGWRPMWLLLVYLALIAVTVSGALAWANRDRPMQAGVGTALFGTLVPIAIMLLAFITPALTVGSVSGERERQTLDLLLVTRASPLGLVVGKLLAATLYVLYLLAVAVPGFAVVYLFGGVPPPYLLLAFAVASATALACASLGLLVSALTRRTLPATVITYLLVLLLLVGVQLFTVASGRAGLGDIMIWTRSTDADTPRVAFPPFAWAYLSPSVTMLAILDALRSSSGAFGGVTATEALPLSQAAYVTGWDNALHPAAELVISWAPWVFQLAGSAALALICVLAAGLALAPVKPWQRWRRGRTRASQERLLN